MHMSDALFMYVNILMQVAYTAGSHNLITARRELCYSPALFIKGENIASVNFSKIYSKQNLVILIVHAVLN